MKRLARFALNQPVWVTFATLAVVLILAGAPALAADEAAASATEQDVEAMAILMKMAGFISKAPAFSVTLRSSYDSLQADGQSIEFGEKRAILLQRPDRLRVEVERSDGERGLILFDGQQITAFKADENVYARAEKSGTVDDALVFLVRDLQMTLPLARMLHSGFPQQIEKKITAISTVEENTLFDVVTDHLAIRSEDVDMQLWVAQGDEPLPRRVVITYKNAPGQPRFRGDFSDWSLAPKASAESFTFTPPEGVEQIPLLARVRQKSSLPAENGGAK